MAARDFFEVMKGLAPGLERFGPEVSAELSRLNTQATMELASAIFHGQGFVPYGPGQYTPTPELSRDTPAVEPQQQLDRGGLEM